MSAEESARQSSTDLVGTPGRARRRGLIAGCAALVVAASTAAAVVVATGGGGPEPGVAAAGSASRSSAATASLTATPSPSATATSAQVSGSPGSAVAGATGDVDQLPPTLTPVSLDRPVDNGGVTASLAKIEAITGEATGVGQVNGSALRITVELRNGLSTRMTLDQVSVNLTYSAEQTPAPPLADRSSAPFAGSLAPGAVARGVYVFRIPENARDDVRIEVGSRAGAPIAVFTGAVR